MSTRATVKYERDESNGMGFHLYEDVFDDEHVYLELDGFHCEAATSVELSGHGLPHLVVKFPLRWAAKMGLIAARKARRRTPSRKRKRS